MAKAGINKKKIMDITVKIVDEHGLETLSCKTVAEKLGIRLPSLYHHVKSMDGLLIELSLHGLSSLHGELVNASIGKSGDDAIISICNAYYDFAVKHPGLYRAIQWENKGGNKEINEAIDSLKMLLEKVLGQGFFDNKQSINKFRIIRSMVHGFSVLGTHDRFDNSCSVKESFKYGAQILVKEIMNFE